MPLVNLRTLSKQYSISVSKLRDLVKTGLPHYRLGRKILVDPEEFEPSFKARFGVNANPESGGLGQVVNKILDEMDREDH